MSEKVLAAMAALSRTAVRKISLWAGGSPFPASDSISDDAYASQ